MKADKFPAPLGAFPRLAHDHGPGGSEPDREALRTGRRSGPGGAPDRKALRTGKRVRPEDDRGSVSR